MGRVLRIWDYGKWDVKKVDSEFIRDEIIKRDYANPEDRLYVEDLLNLEHWIENGNDNKTHDGFNIPWFYQSHYTQVIFRRKREHRKIMLELKGRMAYEEWYGQEHGTKWYSKKIYFSDNSELLRKANIRRIGPKSFLFYACNECGSDWNVPPMHNGEYARKGGNRWWKCPNGCNKDVVIPRTKRRKR